MAKEFLREVVKVFVNSGSLEYVFVLPNRRSLKFFQKFLGQEWGNRYGKPVLSPQIITINEFVENLSDLKLADPLILQYILYKEYIKVKYPNIKEDIAQAKESFDDFLGWGNVILKDFNDIDKYIVDPKQLFTNIKELKEIEEKFSYLTPNQLEAVKLFWTNFLKGGKISQKKEFFSSIWGVMYTLYTNYKETLKSKGISYEGQMYRDAAENIALRKFDKEIVFIGFNAPNRCELKIMSHLKNTGKGDFYWDFYGDYLLDKDNTAGEIIRYLVKEYPSRYKLPDTTVQPAQQNINVISVPSAVGQSFVVSRILENLYPMQSVSPEETISTAIVLPDESLLLPVLNSIGHKFDSLNVTMGYPIAATAFNSFINHITALQKDVRLKGDRYCFYHKSVMELLSHEYVRKLSGSKVEQIKSKIVKDNIIYIEQGDSLLHEDEFLDKVFTVALTTKDVIEYQLQLLKILDQALPLWDREFIYQYYLQINRLKELDIPMEVKTYVSLIQKLSAGISVPFTGEPLRGLQIMGTLETRLLDFENVIIVSANEGKFPANTAEQSLIPYNLRFGFGLPTYELVDGIASYHFYRSICRAKNVYMVYDSTTEGLTTGEVSRYVKQLKYHFNLNINESVATSKIRIGTGVDTSIVKSDQIMELLHSKYVDGQNSLSASAINNYLTCPLKFYFENVEGIEQDDEVVEGVESNTFGTIFHNVLEQIYSKYKNEIVSEQIIKKERDDNRNIERLIGENFAKELNVKEIKGRNIIIKELLKKYISLTFDYDISVAPFVYEDGEKRVEYKLPIYGGTKSVNFKAFVDRVDKLCQGDLIRVIDYKTGSINELPQGYAISGLFDGSIKKDCKVYIQLYLYALMMFDSKLVKGEALGNIAMVVYLIKKMSDAKTLSVDLEADKLMEFKQELTKCVEEIFNKDVPFGKKAGDHCKWCPLNALCSR